jgi:hypothetical protein
MTDQLILCANEHPHRMHQWQLSLSSGNGPWLSCPGRMRQPTVPEIRAWAKQQAVNAAQAWAKQQEDKPEAGGEDEQQPGPRP